MEYRIDHVTSRGDSSPVEGDTVTVSLTREDTASDEEIYWEIIFSDENRPNYHSLDLEDISGPSEGTLSYLAGEDTKEFSFVLTDDSLIEPRWESFGILMLDANMVLAMDVKDDDCDVDTLVDVNSSTAVAPWEYAGNTLLVDLSEGGEYSMDMVDSPDQTVNEGYFEVYDPQGAVIDDYVLAGDEFIYTAETSGIYRIEAKSSNATGLFNFEMRTTTDSNRQAASDHLELFGIELDQAKQFLLSNIDNPEHIYNVSDSYEVNEVMLAGIVEVDVLAVRNFFESHGFDSILL